MVENNSIMTFYLKSVRDGFVFGIEIPKRDIHLTIIYNQEKNLIQPHLTDKNKEGETAQHPWGQWAPIWEWLLMGSLSFWVASACVLTVKQINRELVK